MYSFVVMGICYRLTTQK